MPSDQEVLDEFVSSRPAAEPACETGQHYELVVRTSCGGTGISTQVEDHYRIFHNELRNVWQFVSRHDGSDPTVPLPSTILERRWFTTGPMAKGERGGTLVEATSEFGANTPPMIQWEVRSLLGLPGQLLSRNLR
jgi:hypothetical protein